MNKKQVDKIFNRHYNTILKNVKKLKKYIDLRPDELAHEYYLYVRFGAFRYNDVENILTGMFEYTFFAVLREEYREHIRKEVSFEYFVDNIQENQICLKAKDFLEKLNEREQEVVRMLEQGYSRKEIAKRIFVSEQNLRANILKRIRKKVKEYATES